MCARFNQFSRFHFVFASIDVFFFFFERIVSLIIVKMCKKVYIKVCYASFYLNDHLIRAPPRIFLKFGILDIVENINADQY